MKSRNILSVALVAALAIPTAPVNAEMIDASAGTHRTRIHAVVERDETKAQLAARGIDPAQLEARIAALSEEEAALVGEDMDRLPAGGRAEALVFALGVVLVVAYIVPILMIGTGALIISKAAQSKKGADGA